MFRKMTLSPRFLSVTSYNNQIGQIQNTLPMIHTEDLDVLFVKFNFEIKNNVNSPIVNGIFQYGL